MERKIKRMILFLLFVGGGVKIFYVKNGGDFVEVVYSKYYFVYYLEKIGGVRCNYDFK